MDVVVDETTWPSPSAVAARTCACLRTHRLDHQPDDRSRVRPRSPRQSTVRYVVFISRLDVDEEVADILIDEGFSSLERNRLRAAG